MFILKPIWSFGRQAARVHGSHGSQFCSCSYWLGRCQSPSSTGPLSGTRTQRLGVITKVQSMRCGWRPLTSLKTLQGLATEHIISVTHRHTPQVCSCAVSLTQADILQNCLKKECLEKKKKEKKNGKHLARQTLLKPPFPSFLSKPFAVSILHYRRVNVLSSTILIIFFHIGYNQPQKTLMSWKHFFYRFG